MERLCNPLADHQLWAAAQVVLTNGTNLVPLAMKIINVQNANSMWKVTNGQALLVAQLVALIIGTISAESAPTHISVKNVV